MDEGIIFDFQVFVKREKGFRTSMEEITVDVGWKLQDN